MPFNPSGVFVRLYRWVTDRDNSIPIDSTRMDAEIDGMVTGINAIVSQTQAFTGPVKSPAGTALTPGHSFDNDPDTGMYRSGANTIGFSAGGSNVLTMGQDRITVSKPTEIAAPLSVTSGTEADPGVQFSNTNNGIYWSPGNGPSFTAAGATIGQLRGGTALSDTFSIVTRQAGDARYMQQSWTLTAGDGLTGAGSGAANRAIAVDGTVLRTTGAQTISGTKTFTGNVVFRSDQQTTLFDINDASQRDLFQVRRNGNGQWFIRLLANNTFEIAGAGINMMRIGAPVELGLGDGPIYLENNPNDGTGTGLCVRASSNPTGNGMIFSVRSSGGALGLGVQQDKVSSGRSDMYLGASDTGAGGNRVHHSGLGAGEIGTYAMLADVNTSADLNPGATRAGSNLRYASAGGQTFGSAPAGTWQLCGFTPGGSSSHEQRATVWMRVS